MPGKTTPGEIQAPDFVELSISEAVQGVFEGATLYLSSVALAKEDVTEKRQGNARKDDAPRNQDLLVGKYSLH